MTAAIDAGGVMAVVDAGGATASAARTEDGRATDSDDGTTVVVDVADVNNWGATARNDDGGDTSTVDGGTPNIDGTGGCV